MSNNTEVTVVAHDVYFEVSVEDITLYPSVRVTGNQTKREAIIAALEAESVDFNEDEVSELIKSQVALWNENKTIGYHVAKVVPLKEVEVEVEYEGKMLKRTILVPVSKIENNYNLYYKSIVMESTLIL